MMTDHNKAQPAIVKASITGNAQRAQTDAQEDDQQNAPGAGPLLGLELTNVENKRENREPSEDSNKADGQNPLLGTIYLKSLNKSSSARSSGRICYESLLRLGAHRSDLSIRNTARNGPRGCYGFIW